MTDVHEESSSDPAPPCDQDAPCDPDHAWKALGLVNEWLRHAEAKSATSLAAAGVVGGVLFNLLKDRSLAGPWVNTSSIVCAIAVVCAGGCAAIALWPRLRATEDPTSVLYFSHIARRRESPATYAETLMLLTSDTQALTKEIAHQVRWNAGVAHTKYLWAGRALSCLLVAIAALAFTAAIVARQATS